MVRKAFSILLDNDVTLMISCTNIERLINLCVAEKIQMREIQRKDFTTVLLKIQSTDYKTLRTIARKVHARVKIMNRAGIHFWFAKLCRRIFFAAGFGIFILMLLFLSSRIWSIQIEGAKRVDPKLIIAELNKNGLHKGCVKSGLPLREIEKALVQKIDEISIVKIDYMGTTAIIHITERTLPSAVEDNITQSDVIASKSGIIEKLVVYKGIPLMKPGDYAKQGQTIVMGLVSDIGNPSNIFTHAKAAVTAKTWYETSINADYNYKFEQRTGRFKQQVYYEMGKYKLYVKKGNIDYQKYDKIETKSARESFGIKLPIHKVIEYYYEKKDTVKRLSFEEAYEYCMKKAIARLSRIVPANAILRNVKLYKKSDKKGVTVTMLYIMEENIGIEKTAN